MEKKKYYVRRKRIVDWLSQYGIKHDEIIKDYKNDKRDVYVYIYTQEFQDKLDEFYELEQKMKRKRYELENKLIKSSHKIVGGR